MLTSLDFLVAFPALDAVSAKLFLPLDLLRIIVTDGVPLRGPAHAVAAAGQGEKALDEGGLSVTTVAQQADISDVLRRITHNLFHSLRFEGRLAGQVTRQPLLTII